MVGTGMCGRSTHAGFFVGSSHLIIRIHCFTIFSGHTVKIGHIVSAMSHTTYVIALVSQIRNRFSVSVDFCEHEAGWQKKTELENGEGRPFCGAGGDTEGSVESVTRVIG